MSGKQSQYDIGLDKTPANYVPLTPLSFIARSAAVYPNHVSAVYEGRAFTWADVDLEAPSPSTGPCGPRVTPRSARADACAGLGQEWAPREVDIQCDSGLLPG